MVAQGKSRAVTAILVGGLLASIGDITQAFIVFGHYYPGATPFRILQGIARGFFGPHTREMGWTSAIVGLCAHFLIATTAAAVYYFASRKLRFMISRWIICGLLFGECVFLFMYFVVMPLSKVGWPHFDTATYITGPFGHTFLVGLPISFSVRRFSR